MQRTRLSILVLILCPLLAMAQPAAEARVGYEAIRAGDMHALLSFLASDALEGRETGTRGLDLAARFLEAQFSLYGLTPAPGASSMLQRFDLQLTQITPRTALQISTAKTTLHSYQWLEDFFSRNLGNVSSVLEGQVVFAGYGISDPEAGWDDYKNIDVRGKIVVLLPARNLSSVDAGPLAELRKKLRPTNATQGKTAESKGASAVFYVGPASIPEMIKDYRRILSAANMSLPQPPAARRFVSLTVSQRVADDLLAETGITAKAWEQKLASSKKPIHHTLKKARVRLLIDVEQSLASSQNVVAYLEGRDPLLKKNVVVFSAHYDHLGKNAEGTVYNGADDDGSGTTGVLEIAQAFARNPVRPKRSVMFIAHAGEEKGLLGSDYFTSHPLVPLENITADLNIDMIGRNDSDQVYIIGSDHLSSELHRINEAANQTVGMKFDYTYNDVNDPNRFYYRSDHYNFAKRGIPIIFYFTGIHEDYHQPGDDVDKINFNKMQKIARLIYLTGWQVANLDHSLVVDRHPPGEPPTGGTSGNPGSRP